MRFTDGTLGVRLLCVADSTVRTGVARGGRGSGLEGLAPLCGQLTRCFSAVAELLVAYVADRTDWGRRLHGATENAEWTSRDLTLTTRHQIKQRCTVFMLHGILYECHYLSLCNNLLRDLGVLVYIPP